MGSEFINALQTEYAHLEERIEELRNIESSIRAELAERLRAATEELGQAEARQRHIQALLVLDRQPPDGQTRTVKGIARTSTGSLADEAYRLLQEYSHEMHYRDMAAALQGKGIDIPGKDPAINLVAHIHNDTRLIRPQRGVYGLKEWYAKGMKSVGTRRKKRRRRGIGNVGKV